MILTADVPPGFELTTDDNGHPVVRHRPEGFNLDAVLSVVWLSVWMCACLWLAYVALFAPAKTSACIALFIPPFWGALIFVTGWRIWAHFSVTRITLGPDVMEIERHLHRFRSRQQFARGEVTAVRRIGYTGTNLIAPTSWGLAIDSGTTALVLERKSLDKVNWLGTVIARWADVPFAPGWDIPPQED
ncbi:Uncharacterized protein OS=Leptolyngbya sp. PCC 7376 GN=Lepto7376_0923 PE=4 SV=1 [Gemmata massiliana]|uniref:DUF304 domain-containing protein n=1 Tax=Gemmata massiliana TaxID=1210884 RepID=A0A6P2CZG1_9BACT|nr:hypothetical protein [Gemmata massiliana]VTR93184.1 Uncharacterized protein OS=Leptolyngbya sp. PCC 7376 GN=Lepto7376_0923 PE=4 SV=1 [Gemmata massiliana]